MKLIIDTDPGVDDALAILYAAKHPGIDLLGLTTVFGNVTVEQATRNALHLVERTGLDIPVAQGAGQPLLLPPFEPSRHVHGDEGFGGLPAMQPARRAADEAAPEFLVRMAREHAGELVICPIGPITNIARAITLDPGFVRNVKQIVFMGGALDVPGNITEFAEANTYHDPHALDIVLGSGADILMVGLDVTMQVLLDMTDFEELARIDRQHGEFLRDAGRFYLDFYGSKGLSGCGFHDPMAVMACVEPDILHHDAEALQVVLHGDRAGQTTRNALRPQVRVAKQSAAERIKQGFFETMSLDG